VMMAEDEEMSAVRARAAEVAEKRMLMIFGGRWVAVVLCC
jgi:hypothetical protein